MRTYVACLTPVRDHGRPPAAFLDELIDVIASMPDEVFTVNDRDDIYGILRPALGPWTGLLHRRAALCEALRVDAAFESGWDWDEGADTTAAVALEAGRRAVLIELNPEYVRLARARVAAVNPRLPF